MWIPAAMTICMLAPTGTLQENGEPEWTHDCKAYSEVNEEAHYATELHCVYEGHIWAVRHSAAHPPDPVISIHVECRRDEGNEV